jgi:surface polysaccharide O-acyltransferase-like enzyme
MAFMVLGLHAGFLSDYSKSGEFLFVNGIFRIAVPIFFIINGYYFYSSLDNNTQATWLKKIATLYFIWMAFYAPIWFVVPYLESEPIANILITSIIGYHHLWYVSGLIGAALLLMLLKNINTLAMTSLIILTFLIGVIIQYSGNYHIFKDPEIDNILNTTWVHRNFIFLSFPFFCTGFLIKKHSLNNLFSNTHIIIGIVFSIIFLIIESFINLHAPGRDGAFDNYLTLIFVCPLIFIYFQKKYTEGKTKNIALYSSAIYFIHSFVLSLLRFITDLKGTVMTILAIVISVFISFYIIKLNKIVKIIL